jgi:hypothetical protein
LRVDKITALLQAFGLRVGLFGLANVLQCVLGTEFYNSLLLVLQAL